MAQGRNAPAHCKSLKLKPKCWSVKVEILSCGIIKDGNAYFLIWPLDEEARPQRRNRSRRRRNRGNRPEGGSTSRDRQPGESGESSRFTS